MKYTIKLLCGHEEVFDLFGKTSEHKRKIECIGRTEEKKIKVLLKYQGW